MESHELPTWNTIVSSALDELDTARNGLSEARLWLASDWRPVGSPLTPQAGDARAEALRKISAAKDLIDAAKSALYRAENGTGTR